MIEIRRGVTRTVILTRRWAIKVPAMGGNGRGFLWSITAGIQANLSEREWGAADNIAPVVRSFGGVINVHRRAASVEHVPADAYPTLTHAKGVALRTDPKPANVGLLDGRLVWLDYDQSQGSCQACQGAARELLDELDELTEREARRKVEPPTVYPAHEDYPRRMSERR